MSYQDGNVSPGEGLRGNSNTQTRRRISEIYANKIASEQVVRRSEERRTNRINQFGNNGERISEIRRGAVQDRLNAVPYNPNKYEDKYDQNNYYEGFFNMGNRALQGQIEQLSDEELQAIARNDYISGVDANSLHESVRNNVSYTEGYMMASIFGTEKGKGRR